MVGCHGARDTSTGSRRRLCHWAWCDHFIMALRTEHGQHASVAGIVLEPSHWTESPPEGSAFIRCFSLSYYSLSCCSCRMKCPGPAWSSSSIWIERKLIFFFVPRRKSAVTLGKERRTHGFMPQKPSLVPACLCFLVQSKLQFMLS